ncbi:UNVERIFIED_CONTAM: hypothetical protein ABID98_006002 [Brevibacillus sp. OAP136]
MPLSLPAEAVPKKGNVFRATFTSLRYIRRAACGFGARFPFFGTAGPHGPQQAGARAEHNFLLQIPEQPPQPIHHFLISFPSSHQREGEQRSFPPQRRDLEQKVKRCLCPCQQRLSQKGERLSRHIYILEIHPPRSVWLWGAVPLFWYGRSSRPTAGSGKSRAQLICSKSPNNHHS